MIDDTADAIIRRWPTPRPTVQPAPSRRDWLGFAFWVVRLCAECLGWLAILGALNNWL